MWSIHVMKYYIDPVTCYNTDEHWEHYATWNKLLTKGQMLWVYSCEICRAVKIIRTDNRKRGYQELGGGRRENWCLLGKEFVLDDEKFYTYAVQYCECERYYWNV